MGQLRFIPDQFRPALTLLLTAHDYAEDSHADPWQFALEIAELHSNGATPVDIRWLIHRGFAEHARETTIAGDRNRLFRPLALTSFSPDACLVLTTEGAAAIRSLLTDAAAIPPSQSGTTTADDRMGRDEAEGDSRGRAPGGAPNPDRADPLPPQTKTGSGSRDLSPWRDREQWGGPTSDEPQKPKTATDGAQRASTDQSARSASALQSSPPNPEPKPLVPYYDAQLHELRLGNEIIKRFTRPAPAQELILAVFQEEDWPPSIDDPLPSQYDQDPKRRLHYTIYNLNHGQKPLRIRFLINGHGETIRWEIVT